MAKHLFIIGAQRSGTTYLYKALDAHPEVFMAKPVKPEPKYFMKEENAGKGYDAYIESHFSMREGSTWFGEKSTSYLESELAAESISNTIQAPTLLVMLRNPVDRALSNYAYTCDNGLEPLDFEAALREESSRKESWQSMGTSVSPFAYTERGEYSRYLDQWAQVFGRERLILLVYEQLVGKQSAISALYERLGISPSFVSPGLTELANPSSAVKSGLALPLHVREGLHEAFEPWNRDLAGRYDLDLTCWKPEQ